MPNAECQMPNAKNVWDHAMLSREVGDRVAALNAVEHCDHLSVIEVGFRMTAPESGAVYFQLSIE